MFSLQRLLSKGDRFFDLLVASAEEARESVAALLELLEAPMEERTIEKFVLRRSKDKRIAEQISSLLCNSFITPLEREDIEALSHALSRIPKTIKKFAERFLFAQASLPRDGFEDQTQLLKQATDTLYEMVHQLRGGGDLGSIQELNSKLHSYEGAADAIILNLLRQLYSGKYEALQMIVLRDLYELLEKVIDRCRDAGNVVLQITLKNS
jgi:uncharacterized protein Yka (UPF0111/DUF47 family)